MFLFTLQITIIVFGIYERVPFYIRMIHVDIDIIYIDIVFIDIILYTYLPSS